MNDPMPLLHCRKPDAHPGHAWGSSVTHQSGWCTGNGAGRPASDTRWCTTGTLGHDGTCTVGTDPRNLHTHPPEGPDDERFAHLPPSTRGDAYARWMRECRAHDHGTRIGDIDHDDPTFLSRAQHLAVTTVRPAAPMSLEDRLRAAGITYTDTELAAAGARATLRLTTTD